METDARPVLPYVYLPRVIENDCDYIDELHKSFNEYNQWLNSHINYLVEELLPLSDGIASEPDWKQLKKETRKIEEDIIIATEKYYCGELIKAQQIVCEILKKLINIDEISFLVSDINKSYATRGIAPFNALHTKIIDYSELYARKNSETLSFFRARTDDVESYKNMLHIPLNQRDSIGTQRFSVPGTPCLYLGTSSYDVWREIGRPAFDRFNVSAFKLNHNCKHSNIIILNLISSVHLICGLSRIPSEISEKTMKLIVMQMKIWPIVCATSFRVKNSKKAFHSEYIVSHLITQCLRELEIDGIAYLSKQITPEEEEYAFPAMVNVAIPVFSGVTDKKFAPICSKIEITDPVNFQEFQGIDKFRLNKNSKCYLSKTLNEKNPTKVIYSKRLMEYRNTYFNWFDDFLCGQKYYSVNVDSV